MKRKQIVEKSVNIQEAFEQFQRFNQTKNLSPETIRYKRALSWIWWGIACSCSLGRGTTGSRRCTGRETVLCFSTSGLNGDASNGHEQSTGEIDHAVAISVAHGRTENQTAKGVGTM
jgi:hypothetical protein